MKRILRIGIIIFLIGICAVTAHIIYLFTLTPKETYPEDTYLRSEKNMSALIIVAHDDDAAPFSGTTSLLAAKGWDISFVCFYNHLYKPEETPIRKVEMGKAAAIQGFRNLELIDFAPRNRPDNVEQLWTPVPYDQFPDIYKIDSLKRYMLNAIKRYNPSIIFTLDNVIGAYGHPEHVVVSRSVMEICRAYKDSLNFPVKKIYQSVLPPSQAEKILGNKDIYVKAKRAYGCTGMPPPDVQVNISSFKSTKKKVFLAHASQHRALSRFIPYYHYYPGWLYFGIFNKEYFRIIDIDEL